MSLIDKYLPEHSFAERHEILISALPEQVMAAVVKYDPGNDLCIRRLIGLREIPARVAGAFLREKPLPPAPFGLSDFLLLERDENRDIAYGLLGRFWRPNFGLIKLQDSAAFATFEQPGVAKLVLSFATQIRDDGVVRLMTETRVHCPDRFSRLLFMPYWFIIRPASGFIRRRILTAIKRTTESTRSEATMTS